METSSAAVPAGISPRLQTNEGSGKSIDAGKKSLTFRLSFRAGDRTLRHDEVDPQTDAVMNAMESSFGALFRSRTPAP